MLSTVAATVILAQPVTVVPSLITGEYRLDKAATIKGQTITIRGTAEKPAVLALCAPYSRLNDCKIVLEGNALVVLYRADNSSVRRTRFVGGDGTQLRIIRSASVTIEDSQFIGDGNKWSLLEAVPGHPWQFDDAGEFGFPYARHTRYEGGTNRFCHVNPLDRKRTAKYDGSGTITIELGGLDLAFNPAYPGFAARNLWQVWQGSQIYTCQVLRSDSTSVVLKAPRGIAPGEVYWQTYNPSALVPNLTIKNCQLVNLTPGSGSGTGVSIYAHKLSVIEGCTAVGFSDYGAGFEWPDRCSIIRCAGSGNQPYVDGQGNKKTWNDFEMVAPVGPVVFRGNIGNQTEVRYFYAPQKIESDRTVREQAVPAPLPNSADDRTLPPSQ